jgi:hypothetical protein
MKEGVILNPFEAILFVNGRGVRLYHSEGDVRSIVRYMLLPFVRPEELDTADKWDKAVIGMTEDTAKIDVA